MWHGPLRTSRRPVETGPSTAKGISGAARVSVTLGFLCAASLVCALAARGDADARQLVPLALPASDAGQPLWADRRAAFAGRLQRGYDLDENTAAEFAGWILEAGTRQRLAPELLASLVMAESSFRKDARSHVGAVGPAQVRVDLWRGFCDGHLEDPEENLYCGAQILAHYHDLCARYSAADDQQACALRSYNLGFGNRNSADFLGAAARYLAKIDRFRTPLGESA